MFDDRLRNVAVLSGSSLGDVHPSHDLQPRNHLGRQFLRKLHDVVQHAVDAEPNSQTVLIRVDMNIGRVELKRSFEEQVNQRRRSDHIDQFPQLFLKGFLTNFQTFGSRTTCCCRSSRCFSRHERPPDDSADSFS